QEWIERDLDAARFQFRNEMLDAVVGRRAAISSAAIDLRHQPRLRARKAGHRPGAAMRFLLRIVDAGTHLAMLRAQIVAEPADHNRDALDIGANRLQIVERGHY